MKKILYIFIILCVLFIGMELGGTTDYSKSEDLNDKIDDFEDEITDPNNNYIPGQDNNKIDPNITNNIAKTGEKAISEIFEYTFKFLEKFVSGK